MAYPAPSQHQASIILQDVTPSTNQLKGNQAVIFVTRVVWPPSHAKIPDQEALRTERHLVCLETGCT